MGKFIDYVTTTDTMWTAKQLCEYADQGIVVFDNVVQRNLVWNLKQKSLLIHSLIVNYMPPEFLANKKDGIYDMIDGKQRHNAISSFMKNDYRLSEVPDLVSMDGEVYPLEKKLFSELDPEIQDKIVGRALKISVMDNASPEVIKEYFYRRNNGTALTAARKTFSKAKSFDAIVEMSMHPIFDIMYASRAKGGDNSKGIVMKSYVILYHNSSGSLENKKVFSIVKTTEFLEDRIAEIMRCYDTMVAVYGIVKAEEEKIKQTRKRGTEKENTKATKRMMTQTHMVTLMPIVKYVNDNRVDLTLFAKWILYFFSSTDGASVSEEYNNNATTGSSKGTAVLARRKAMEDNFHQFIAESK